jgi:hypothetical protein
VPTQHAVAALCGSAESKMPSHVPAAQQRRLALLQASLQNGHGTRQSVLGCRQSPRMATGASTGRSVAPFTWPPSPEPIFEPYSFDAQRLQRDGYVVLPGIMTGATRRRWKAACIDVQQLNDRLLMETDWASVDWGACGLEQPSESVSRADLEPALGGCQLPVPPGVRPAGFSHFLHRNIPGLAFGWGGFIESHAVQHSEFLQYVAAHPDMLKLHSKLLGVPDEEIRFDHGLILNRKCGFRGQNWHSHSYRHEGADDVLGAHDENAELGRSLVRTLCYPDGYAAETSGGLGVVPGSHHYRDYVRSGDVASWIEGKIDADGQPLRVVREALPPGSIVSLLCHSLHAVSPVQRYSDGSGGDTRWASLFCYR